MGQFDALHQRKSIRLKHYDYSDFGAYFVTICVNKRDCLFGSIQGGKVLLSRYGKIVLQCWKTLNDYYTNIKLDESLIMPDHMHGIIWLTNDRISQAHSTGRISLGRIVAYFKYQTTKRINVDRQSPGLPVWLRNFYDRVIRNDKDLNETRQYIRDNPLVWEYGKEITYPWL